MEACAEERVCFEEQNDFNRMMRVGSRELARVIKFQRGLSWQCGHEKSPDNTQWFRGEARCRTCRKERWERGFAISCGRILLNRADAAINNRAEELKEIRLAEYTRFLAWLEAERKDVVARHEKLSLETLKAAVCAAFDISDQALRGKGRYKDVVHARAVLFKILRDRKHSYPTIGRVAGGRDHSTIINSVRKFDWYCTSDPRVAETYELLKDRVNAS